jgi:RNA polymerase-binding transcription factor DksA
MASAAVKPLSRGRLDSLKRELERELERATRDLVRLQPIAVGTVSGWDGSVAEREQADAMASELYCRAEYRCAQINEALDRISKGTYGICVVCH